MKLTPLALLPVFLLGIIFGVSTITAQERMNNRLGVHILETAEIEKAAQFVNAGEKKWGYVIIPIRIDDRDYDKWKKFFEKASDLKVIPIIRLAMHADNLGGWAIPTDDEILYSAKFLNQMPWPIKYRYIIVFNEPNHAAEWGGQINPAGYAERLNFAIDVFKHLDGNFFMMNAALDWAAPNSSTTMRASDYWEGILAAKAELASKIDGLNSHAYPNPAFSSDPRDKRSMGIGSYKIELDILKENGRNEIPVFITETNWSNANLSEKTRQDYWQIAWNQVWIEEEIKTIGVWLLEAHDGSFKQFSLFRDNKITDLYTTLSGLSRDSGDPEINLPLLPSPTQAVKEAGESGQTSEWLNWKMFSNIITWLKSWWSDNDKKMTNDIPPSIRFENGSQLYLEIAQTPQQIEKGLMFRTSLDQNWGMLFLINDKEIPSFWMKNTLISLDMIWIKNNKIIDIHKNIPVEQDPSNPKNIYRPMSTADQILEVNGGWSDKNGIKIGDSVSLIGKIK